MPRSTASQAFQSHLFQPQILALLEQCAKAPLDEQKDLQAYILQDAIFFGRFQDRDDWMGFLSTSLSFAQTNDHLKALLEVLRRLELDQRPWASHQEKRALITQLGIKQSLGSVLVPLDTLGFEQAAVKLLSDHGIRLILRDRSVPIRLKKDFPNHSYHSYKKGYILTELQDDCTNDKTILCNASTGFLVIAPTESVIVVSKTQAGYELELVVIRQVPNGPPALIQPLFKWLSDVVLHACSARRDVRPNHEGCMVQIGLNMGPRHARVLGWAKSFVKKLSESQMIQGDQELIGGMSLFWALVKTHIPTDIVNPIQDLLDSGFPSMASRNISPGTGFTIEIDGIEYTFSQASRAPPEGYATVNYQAPTHVDPADEIKWSFGWTINRQSPATGDSISEHGANFVDLGLKVVVQNATGTLTAFRPEVLHGTTYHAGVKTCGLSLTFTRRVHVAYKEFAEKGAFVDNSAEIQFSESSNQ